jgi:hypothetical protein
LTPTIANTLLFWILALGLFFNQRLPTTQTIDRSLVSVIQSLLIVSVGAVVNGIHEQHFANDLSL